MYSNVAYLGKQDEDIVDYGTPLLVTAAGYYRVQTSSLIETKRPNGRNDYQLMYVYAGKLHVYIQEKEHVIEKGTLLLFRPREAQIYKYYSSEKPEIYWVHFTGFDVENLLKRYELPNDKNIFYSGTSPDYQWLFEQMIRELQLCRANYKELLTMLLRHIFLLINRYLKENGKSGIDALNDIERSIRYFNENYTKDINIDEYAKSLHVSTCWFNRRFKQVTKVTPLQYILSLRLANAKMLLETQDYNVTETSYAVGFHNPLYFSRLFTKHIGLPPSEYKALHSEE